MTDANLTCRCGSFEGHVAGIDQPRGNHIVCYCRDCRAFARACGEDALDDAGGLGLYQTTIGKVAITRGAEHLAAMRMTRRGPVRWYASCCDTALAVTMPSPAIPFSSLVTASVRADGGDERALGPVRGAAFADQAKGKPRVAPLKGAGMLAILANFARLMLGARRRGEHKRSAFHANGKPIAEPRTPEGEEREALYA